MNSQLERSGVVPDHGSFASALLCAAAKGGNRITLLRDADGDGKPEVQTVLVDHLHSPYGVA